MTSRAKVKKVTKKSTKKTTAKATTKPATPKRPDAPTTAAPANDAKAAAVAADIAALRAMTVNQLRERWQAMYGEEARSRNKEFLFRRLAWRVQELAYGGLSDRAKAKLAELRAQVTLADIRVRPAKGFDPAAIAEKAPESKVPAVKRDPRLPRPGSVITRTYRGDEIRVTVTADGFEWKGAHYDSLTALARKITGQHLNGRAFFGLASRKRA